MALNREYLFRGCYSKEDNSKIQNNIAILNFTIAPRFVEYNFFVVRSQQKHARVNIISTSILDLRI